jgi:hypothetical protein
MGTIYQFIQLKRIEFENDSKEVLISCEIIKNMESSHHYFIISHTELNQIFGDLQAKNEDINLYDCLEKVDINSHTSIYSLDLVKNNIKNSWLPEIVMNSNHREIRA